MPVAAVRGVLPFAFGAGVSGVGHYRNACERVAGVRITKLTAEHS